MKHPYVIFVGDKPSAKNKLKSTPFVGTQSYRVLLNWIHKLDLDFRWCDMVNISQDFLKTEKDVNILNKAIKDKSTVVIALGRNASKYLISKKIDSFLMAPHPSPLNRLLNNKRYISNLLKTYKEYIHDTRNWID